MIFMRLDVLLAVIQLLTLCNMNDLGKVFLGTVIISVVFGAMVGFLVGFSVRLIF